MPSSFFMIEAWPYLAFAFFGAYLLGSIPFGLVLCRIFGYGDIRKIGSGNIGATNVLRTGNKPLALATLILDIGKGAVAVLIFSHLWGPEASLVAGLGAILGHMFPVWLKFKGGKGVATILGIIIALNWMIGLATAGTWLLMAAVFRISSLSALIATLACPVYAWFVTHDPKVVITLGIMTALVWVRHHENIRRLLKGEEPKIGKK